MDPVDIARKLRPMLAAAAADIEAQRGLPASLIAEFRAHGLFRLFVPRELGGAELHPGVAARTVAELAHGDASAAWCAMIASQSTWFSAFLPPDGAEEIFRDRDTIVGGQTRAEGRATPVDGGYRVSGRWPFVSGVSHCDWVFGTCVVAREHRSPARPHGRVLAFLPARDVRIVDTWWTSGLCGTGSHDVEAEDVFVPSRRACRFPPVDEAGHGSPLFKDALFNLVFVTQAGQALGVAEAVAETFVELATSASRQGTGATLREQPPVQMQVAEAQALIDASWAYLEKTTGAVWDAHAAGRSASLGERTGLRLAITHAIHSAIRAGDLLHAAAGGAAVYSRHPLNRRFRDLHAAGAHMQAAPRVYEVAGQVLLGLDPKPGPFLP